ncbi:hypothetical protein NSE01_35460 [Novosphingobium sediminis]|uniref:Uncharacterized protein n=1 Tax=Novosphingobium sediminis TaxID=707214 RepID=A0A512APS9_9SPHN|nr:hypothetical protein [Novosphingobium sediminis]GEO01714.1 hypothetical protein NSE01_35460 [Novosphingobium sediminis]
MPITILSLLIVTLAAAVMNDTIGRGYGIASSLLALTLLAVRFGRSGELGERPQYFVRATPAWVILALGIGLIALATWLDAVITDAGTSLVMRRVSGPLAFGLMIGGTEIAIHNRSLR